jgi:hypothetical protein
MKNLNTIASDLFNQLRSRFTEITIGDENGEVINEPEKSRYYDFTYSENDSNIGKVSISLDEEDGIVVMYSKGFAENADSIIKENWYNFLKDIRQFAKKRLLNFEVRDINKNNLQRRDYEYLAKNRSGEQTMAESKMYGTNKTSFQKIGNAKLSIKHTASLDEGENRTKKIGAIYIENNEGEKFKYPFKHLSGARAMARHVAEGGNPYDDFGKHITGLSEELSSLRKFKTYMNRSSVMAESLASHMDIVNERVTEIKKRITNLQKESFYKDQFENFVSEDAVEVPSDIAENWIDQLTVKQFNEELQDVFPYIYKLIGENTKADELSAEDLLGETSQLDEALPVVLALVGLAAGGYAAYKTLGAKNTPLGKALQAAAEDGDTEAQKHLDNLGAYIDGNATSTLKMLRFKYMTEPAAMESVIDRLMGQFAAQINEDEETDEGNAYAHAVRQAKMNGKKKGDKIDGPDGDEITLEKEKKTPLGEFILSYFDRETGQFPKGPTAVLTMVEKEYGEQYVRPAQEFIERIDAKVAEVMGYRETDVEESGLQYYTGKKKYGKEGMAKLAQAGREGASEEELGRIKDKYKKESDMDESRVGTAIRKFGDIRKSGNEKGAKAGYFSYIYDLDDATAVLSHLRKRAKIDGTAGGGDQMGKDAGFANDYINLTYNVGEYLRNITDNFTHAATPPGLKAALNDMFQVRGAYKRAETGGEKAYSSQAIDPLYGVMLQIDDLAYNARRMGESTEDLNRIKNLAGM